jgi:hypothetical protein
MDTSRCFTPAASSSSTVRYHMPAAGGYSGAAAVSTGARRGVCGQAFCRDARLRAFGLPVVCRRSCAGRSEGAPPVPACREPCRRFFSWPPASGGAACRRSSRPPSSCATPPRFRPAAILPAARRRPAPASLSRRGAVRRRAVPPLYARRLAPPRLAPLPPVARAPAPPPHPVPQPPLSPTSPSPPAPHRTQTAPPCCRA